MKSRAIQAAAWFALDFPSKKSIASRNHEWTRINANESQKSNPICSRIGNRRPGHNEGIRPEDRSDYFIHAKPQRHKVRRESNQLQSQSDISFQITRSSFSIHGSLSALDRCLATLRETSTRPASSSAGSVWMDCSVTISAAPLNAVSRDRCHSFIQFAASK